MCAGEAGRSLLLLSWSALFLSLGWNFLDYGFGITTNNGINGGFLVCGVLFIIMGAVPLIWTLPRLWRLITGHPDPDDAPSTSTPPAFMGMTSVQFAPPPSTTPPSTTPPPTWTAGSSVRMAAPPTTTATAPTPTGSKDLASELERLASLHRRRELTDTEYEAAKRQAIANTEKPT